MPNGMRCLDPSIADRITSLSTMRNNEEIFETFGFSYNTLRKVSNGKPLRRSLADRIEERARKVFEADGFLNISEIGRVKGLTTAPNGQLVFRRRLYKKKKR